MNVRRRRQGLDEPGLWTVEVGFPNRRLAGNGKGCLSLTATHQPQDFPIRHLLYQTFFLHLPHVKEFSLNIILTCSDRTHKARNREILENITVGYSFLHRVDVERD